MKRPKSMGALIGRWSEDPTWNLATAKMLSMQRSHDFYELVNKDSHMYRKRAYKPIRHPLPTQDQGYRYVDCPEATPAQRIGLTEKVFNIDDIIYFK